MESTTLNILCAAVGYKYTEAQILENINFYMTDSTSHNLNVIEGLCEQHGVVPPKALTCNVHPLMMMQKKVIEVFRLLHDTIGGEKLKQCFLSDVDFANDDFITKAMHCLSNFINRDCSAKLPITTPPLIISSNFTRTCLLCLKIIDSIVFLFALKDLHTILMTLPTSWTVIETL